MASCVVFRPVLDLHSHSAHRRICRKTPRRKRTRPSNRSRLTCMQTKLGAVPYLTSPQQNCCPLQRLNEWLPRQGPLGLHSSAGQSFGRISIPIFLGPSNKIGERCTFRRLAHDMVWRCRALTSAAACVWRFKVRHENAVGCKSSYLWQHQSMHKLSTCICRRM